MITHPEKVLFPDDGITKGELAAYYDAIAPVMLPHLRRRPITMERFPAGIGTKGFLQKDVVKGFPVWLKRIEAPKKGGTVHYPLANDVRSLLWLANQNTITVHVWPSRAPRIERPDLCVFDLDPSHDEPDRLREAALGLSRSARRARPGELGEDLRLEGFPYCRAAQGAIDVRRGGDPRRSRGRHPGRAQTTPSDAGVQQG